MMTTKTRALKKVSERKLKDSNELAAINSKFLESDDGNAKDVASSNVSKKRKKKKMQHGCRNENTNMLTNGEEANQDGICVNSKRRSGHMMETREEAGNQEGNVYYISSGDEQCSKGMNRWLKEYHESRPGLQVLQQKIDDFIASQDQKIEQERKEREGRDEEEGWTVVVRPKGRKKIAGRESGSAVHFASFASAQRSVAKKRPKEIALDFYRFQRKEAKMNEILALQSKFEQDRLRIQQLRTARKFKPY